MKKILAVLAMVAMAFSLVACQPSTLSVDSAEDGIHAVATGRAEGSANGSITIPEGFGLCVNHIVEKGSFQVTAYDEAGNIVFDKEIEDNIADLVPVQGEIEVVIAANKARGTIDIIAYDIEAQAMAEGTMPKDVADAIDSAQD